MMSLVSQDSAGEGACQAKIQIYSVGDAKSKHDKNDVA
jgi:hypothetical protein